MFIVDFLEMVHENWCHLVDTTLFSIAPELAVALMYGSRIFTVILELILVPSLWIDLM